MSKYSIVKPRSLAAPKQHAVVKSANAGQSVVAFSKADQNEVAAFDGRQALISCLCDGDVPALFDRQSRTVYPIMDDGAPVTAAEFGKFD